MQHCGGKDVAQIQRKKERKEEKKKQIADQQGGAVANSRKRDCALQCAVCTSCCQPVRNTELISDHNAGTKLTQIEKKKKEKATN